MVEIIKKNIYEVDVDSNGVLALNRKNINFINGILKIDSSYRISWNQYNEKSSLYYIKNKFLQNNSFVMEKDIVKEVVKRIDKENSTHLSSSGINKGDNRGIEITVDKICKIKSLYDRLKKGDPSLVDEIASAVEGKYNISFASKFCTFVSQVTFAGKDESNNYCIYDEVISDILPYYAWIYTDKYYVTRYKNSTLGPMVKKNHNYKEYRDLVDNVLDCVKKENGEFLLKSDFDKIVWYYYKGDKSRRKEVLNKIHK